MNEVDPSDDRLDGWDDDLEVPDGARFWNGAPPAGEPVVEPGDEDRAAALIAAGAGRRRLATELGVTEHVARGLLDRARGSGGGSSAVNGHRPAFIGPAEPGG